MKSTELKFTKCTADEGMVFDWKEPRYETDEEGNEYQIHLYARELFLSLYDSIDNYIEVPAPKGE